MKISLSHGSGGLETAELIETIFIKHFQNDHTEDAAVLPFKGEKLAFTTDSFVVDPIFFPGGDIGRLAVCGTVSDLLTTGGQALYLSASFILEESLESDALNSIAISMREAAKEAGVQIVTGDTKVIEGDGGLYINTAGIGKAGKVHTSKVSCDDAIIVSGTLGDHHACIMSARMGIKNNIRSDVAPLSDMVSNLVKSGIAIHGFRDITRGGLATVLYEIANARGLRADIYEASLPIAAEVKGLCQILGLDPLYMGNEGKMLVIVPQKFAEDALHIIQNSQYGENAAIIGQFAEGSGLVLNTKIGGQRRLSALVGEGLPRIC